MRITQLSLRKVDDKALAILINTLVVSIAQFAALEANITSAECGKIDRATINAIKKGFGLSQKDMKEVIFLRHQQLGMGARNFHGTMMAAKARELECGLNGAMQYCTTLRARWQAWSDRKEDSVDINRFRDRRFELYSAILELIWRIQSKGN